MTVNAYNAYSDLRTFTLKIFVGTTWIRVSKMVRKIRKIVFFYHLPVFNFHVGLCCCPQIAWLIGKTNIEIDVLQKTGC